MQLPPPIVSLGLLVGSTIAKFTASERTLFDCIAEASFLASLNTAV